ncbi:MAG: hypothetical protein LBG14_06835 [Treponema sp.]|jgi:hypothetical protein|nr:hypothetical protein [Treponema sp.]
MKKALFFAAAYGFLCAGFVFGADSYSVRSITGPVYRLGSAGQWIAVSEGDTLSPATIIRIGFNAALTVTDGDTERILRSERQGALESFLGSGAAGSEGRISVGGRAVDSGASPAVSGTSPAAGSSAGAPVRDRELDWAE